MPDDGDGLPRSPSSWASPGCFWLPSSLALSGRAEGKLRCALGGVQVLELTGAQHSEPSRRGSLRPYRRADRGGVGVRRLPNPLVHPPHRLFGRGAPAQAAGPQQSARTHPGDHVVGSLPRHEELARERLRLSLDVRGLLLAEGSLNDEEVVLGDPSTSQVLRIGDTVRRPASRSTPAVHALLRHVEEVGFDGCPRVLGIDEQGREVLTSCRARPSGPTRRWPWSALPASFADSTTPSRASFLRRVPYGFPRASQPGYRVGHNGLGPPNTVYAHGVPYAFIDWELSAPSPPLSDLAWAAINFTPLRSDQFCRVVGFLEPPDRGARLRLFCEAYGLDDSLYLLDKVAAFERDGLQKRRLPAFRPGRLRRQPDGAILELGRAGVSPFNRFLAGGEDRFLRKDLEWFLSHRRDLERALRVSLRNPSVLVPRTLGAI